MIVVEVDPDVGDRIRFTAVQTGLPLETVANKAIRLGLDKLLGEPSKSRYRTIPRPMRLKPGFSYDDLDALSEDI